MSKRTPGPWAVHPTFQHIVVPLSDTKKKIGSADRPDREFDLYAKEIHADWKAVPPHIHADWKAVPPHEYDHLSYFRTRVQPDEAYANARLIAAAPDLLEAAKSALARLHKFTGPYDREAYEDSRDAHAIEQLMAAIRKAEQ